MGLLTFPTSLILLALGEPLTVLLFGPEWRPAGRAVAAMCLFSAGSVVVSLASETWKAAGRPHWLPRTHTLGGVLGIVLAVATVHWGLTAVAASLSASAVLTASYALWGVSRTLRVSVAPLLAQLWAPFLAAIVMTAAAYGLESVVDADHHRTLVGLVLIAVEALAAALVYVGALALLSPRAKRDLVAALVAARSRLRPTRAPGTVTPDPLS
jgi:PST family polysaccharide transporter